VQRPAIGLPEHDEAGDQLPAGRDGKPRGREVCDAEAKGEDSRETKSFASDCKLAEDVRMSTQLLHHLIIEEQIRQIETRRIGRPRRFRRR
jgi:hypothetical protein